ncbi:MAG: hypothetical protein ACRDIX_01025 [Actinomycetota bacterium]
MKIRPAAVAAWGLWAFAAAGSGLGVALQLLGGRAADFQGLFFVLAFSAYATVGAVVASRRPRNPIGWVFLGVGVLTAIGSLGESYARAAFSRPGPLSAAALLAAWTQNWYWYPLLATATFVPLLLFPSGLPSRRWRPVLWLLVLAVASVTVLSALSSTLEAEGRTVPNPIGITGATLSDIEDSFLFSVFGILLTALMGAAVVSLVLRFRRSRGAERQQLKWFAYSAVLVGLSLIASITIPAYERSPMSGLVFGFAIWLIPISCGIAIMKYRLYDIDRIINRTLVYGLLTLILAGVYVAVVVGLGTLVGESAILVAASTLLVAALFRPARGWVQGLIDRRFYRQKYDAARTLEAFSVRLRDEVDLTDLSAELLGVVHATMQPSSASLWLPGRQR